MSIYEMLTDIKAAQKRHDLSFSTLSGQFEELDERLTGRLDALDGKVDAMDARLTGRMDALDTKVGSLDGKVGSLDGKVGSLDGKVDEILSILKGPGAAK
jgi:hypothetical protein